MSKIPAPIRHLLEPLVRPLRHWRATKRGYAYKFVPTARDTSSPATSDIPPNALRDFLNSHKEGRVIHKWDHYFEIYDRHFHKFRGQDVRVLEIGVYGGGSLEMWRDYFGPRAAIYGVDIEPACRAYEREGIKIFIGDQSDRIFWRQFRHEVSALDIIIDDGGHRAEQQIVSLEELLPILRPNGVYLCEDVHGAFHRFAPYVLGLDQQLNEHSLRDLKSACNPFQSMIDSIHLYPFITVIEKRSTKITEFTSKSWGTEWPSF